MIDHFAALVFSLNGGKSGEQRPTLLLYQVDRKYRGSRKKKVKLYRVFLVRLVVSEGSRPASFRKTPFFRHFGKTFCPFPGKENKIERWEM